MKKQQHQNESLPFDAPASMDPQEGKRPGRLTLLNLEWLSERMRKKESVIEKIRRGEYHHDSSELAEKIIQKQD